VSVRDDNGGGADSGRRPFGTVVASAVNGFRALARAHVELLKLEASEAASVRGQGVGMMGAAVVVAMYAVGFLAAAGAAALALLVPVWAAILIVAVLLGAVAGVLILIGRRTLRTAPPPAERTRTALKEDAQWARQQTAR
jgi:Putative Actinobacterial Holin-X, holin superfamily III